MPYGPYSSIPVRIGIIKKLGSKCVVAKSLHFAAAATTTGIYEQIERGGISNIIKQTLIDSADIQDVVRIYGNALGFNMFDGQNPNQYRYEVKRIWNLIKNPGIANNISYLIEAVSGISPLVVDASAILKSGWILSNAKIDPYTPSESDRSIVTDEGIEPSLILVGRRNVASVLSIRFDDIRRYSNNGVHVAENMWGLIDISNNPNYITVGKGVGAWVVQFNINDGVPVVINIDVDKGYISRLDPGEGGTASRSGIDVKSATATSSSVNGVHTMRFQFTHSEATIKFTKGVGASATLVPPENIFLGKFATTQSNPFVLIDDVNITKSTRGMIDLINRVVPAHIRTNIFDVDGVIIE